MGKSRALPFRPFMGLNGDPNVFPCHGLSLFGHHCDAKRSNVCTSHEASCFYGSATRYDLKFSYRALWFVFSTEVTSYSSSTLTSLSIWKPSALSFYTIPTSFRQMETVYHNAFWAPHLRDAQSLSRFCTDDRILRWIQCHTVKKVKFSRSTPCRC
jgi:hypothetical protein